MNSANLGKETIVLKRQLGFFACFFYGVAALLPIAPVPVYGVITSVSGGHAALSYLIAMFAMAFSAWTYGQMGAEFPFAGSSYTFVSKGLGSHLGFLAGWAILVDYVLMPALNYIILGLFINALFPNIPIIYITWIAIVITCTVNLIGIKSLANINSILTIFGFIMAAYFIYSCFNAMGHGVGTGYSFVALYNPATYSFKNILTGASIAAFSYLGFDIMTTLAEETKNPEKTLPRATLLVCFIMGTIFTIFCFVGQAAYPSTTFVSTGVEILDVCMVAGGVTLRNAICIAMIAGGIAYAMDILAAVSRLLFGMGRDGVLPRKVFGYVHPKTYVPVWSTIIVSAICFILSGMTIDRLIPLINFGGLFAYICVNISCFVYFFVKQRRRSGWDIIKYCIVPLAGFVAIGALWVSLEPGAKTIGFIWLGIGILYILVLTRGFKRPMIKLKDGIKEKAE